MAAFKYITRGTQDAQGKQKAYFCAHPDDYEKYFDKISCEILDTLAKENNRNCAFYYLEDANAERNHDFVFNLKQMNLLVMPVTTKLLTTVNPALDVEFRLAVENGIPVLPLMMESGLEDVFNAKCGDLHFLDPNSRDATAISYEEKLSKYLTSILIGEELAEKIRNAFDAYIFLSYRKKDRQYAQELMRLIHKNDFCRDIAIWYDEFLSPGNNFNDSIKSALEKSKLFALAVTPNLVNEENYIMAVEYPMAKKAEKPILPAELVVTDRKALSEMYQGIPECVKSDDAPALSASLQNALEGIALRKNDTDPEHNFFIGLAYLGGIDVEKDTARALELIALSANDGLPEAMQKLVSICRSGEVGERDYGKAIEWQKKLVACRKKAYTEKQDEDSAFDYLHDIWDLGDYLYELQKIDEAEKVYMEMLSASQEINERFNRNWTLRDLSVSYEKLGNIRQARGKLDEAEVYFSKSLDIAEDLASETGTVEARRDLSVSYNKLGNICQARGKLDEAEEYFSKSLDIRENLASETGTVEARRDLSISYNKLGNICQARGKLDEAEVYFSKSLDIRENLASETGTVEAWRDLSVSYEKLGNICQVRSKLDEAEVYFSKSLDIRENLASETSTVEARRDLSVSYNKIGNIFQARGKLGEAEEYFSKFLDIAEQLASETDTVEARRDLLASYSKLGNICQARGRLDKAEEYFSKLLDIAEQLASETGTIEARRDLLASYNNLGNILQARGKLGEAEEYFSKFLNIAEQLASETDTVEARRDLLVSYSKLGNICQARGKLDKAEVYFSKLLNIAEQLASETNTVEARRDLSVSYNKLGNICQAHGKLDEAEVYFSKSLDICESLANEAGTVRAYDDLAFSYYKMASVSTGKKTEYLNKALNSWTQLAELVPDVPRYARNRDIVKRTLGITE